MIMTKSRKEVRQMKLILLVSCFISAWDSLPVSAAGKKSVPVTHEICESLAECASVVKTNRILYSALHKEERKMLLELGSSPGSLWEIWPWLGATQKNIFLKKADKELKRAERYVLLSVILKQLNRVLKDMSCAQTKMAQLLEESSPRVSGGDLKDIKNELGRAGSAQLRGLK